MHDVVEGVELVRLSERMHPRDAGRRCLEEYIRLTDAWVNQGRPPAELPESFQRELSAFPGEASPPGGEVLLAYAGARLVGIGQLVPLAGETCEMRRVYVQDHVRRRRLGTWLATSLLDEARRRGYRRARLHVLASRSTAIRLYQHLGFRVVEPDRQYPFSMVFMEADLENP